MANMAWRSAGWCVVGLLVLIVAPVAIVVVALGMLGYSTSRLVRLVRDDAARRRVVGSGGGAGGGGPHQQMGESCRGRQPRQFGC